jgi:AraC-like DNA-binding protein
VGLKTFRPCPLLSPYIDAYWDYEDLIGENASFLSILPDTATYLCFLYQDPLLTAHRSAIYTTRSGLAGFQSFRSDLGGSGIISGVSARLKPWGLNVFRRSIVPECAERRVDCRDIFPRHTIERIEDDLARMTSASARVAYIERFLMSIFEPGRADSIIQSVCRELATSGGNRRIAELAKLLGLSKRALERRFVNHIGATPKKFARVIRLRKAITAKQSGPSWAEMAHAAGYFDQSHMIHDFIELYGMTPAQLYPQVHASATFRFSGLLDLQGYAARAARPENRA